MQRQQYQFTGYTLTHTVDDERQQHQLKVTWAEDNVTSPWVTTKLPITYDRKGRYFVALAESLPSIPRVFELIPHIGEELEAHGL